eukprot:857369-Heterocapsa_arctica.AAC.1
MVPSNPATNVARHGSYIAAKAAFGCSHVVPLGGLASTARGSGDSRPVSPAAGPRKARRTDLAS